MSSASVAPVAPRIPWAKLALLLLACAALRGFLVLAPSDDFFERGEVPHEELLRGTAAQDLIDGALAPIQRYQVNNFWGGSLVVSLLAVAPYAIFGARIVVLRAVAVAIGVAAVALLFVILHRHASARAAWIGAVLLAFAPPGYAISSCMLYGTHLEANAVALLVVLLALEEQRARGSSRAPTFALGASAGFALWFGFSLVLLLGAWLAHELARDRTFFLRKRALFLAIGFVVGFSPWIRYQLVHGYTGLEIYDAGLGEHLVNGILRGQIGEKLLATFSSTGPASFCFRDTLPVSGLWFGRIFACVAFAAVVRCAWSSRAAIADLLRGRPGARATPATIALAFLAAFALTYVTSRFDADTRDWVFDLRYLMPPVPFVCLAAGIAAASFAPVVRDRRDLRLRRATTAVAIALAAICAWSTARQARPDRCEANLATAGASQAQLLRFLARTIGPVPDEAIFVARRMIDRRDPPRREELLAAYGQGIRTLAAIPARTPSEERRRAGWARSAELVPAALPPEFARVFAGE